MGRVTPHLEHDAPLRPWLHPRPAPIGWTPIVPLSSKRWFEEVVKMDGDADGLKVGGDGRVHVLLIPRVAVRFAQAVRGRHSGALGTKVRHRVIRAIDSNNGLIRARRAIQDEGAVLRLS